MNESARFAVAFAITLLAGCNGGDSTKPQTHALATYSSATWDALPAVSFSWRIMMAPPTVIDYLVAHEVAHLVHMNHGPKFWALCRKLCARTDEARAWLKRNGQALQAIGF